jgi:tRNA pseudouridine38-40 synthase
LPPDIRVLAAAEVGAAFHARYDAKGKRYRYTIDQAPVRDVFRRYYTYHLSRDLCIEAMQKAACSFIGTYDFRSFCASSSSVANFTRNLYSCNVFQENDLIHIEVSASGFLYQMVRIIVGTLLEVGKGKLPVKAIPEIIAARDRTAAGPTAPPHGLCLEQVYY